ncbi:hypothetical protein [Streptomyces acidiscabies]|uniref:hypothetical protein n=1 Tax=Streptomyces acidiscabies TaxID=42234 RepID=UPI000A719BDE|nr:hypothetical protein [Streptomyces acidiscabies]
MTRSFGWTRSSIGSKPVAGAAYREFHRAVAEDSVRIREVVKLLAEAVRLSRDGFSATDLGVLERLRAVRVDVASEVARLFTLNSQALSATSRSTLDAY